MKLKSVVITCLMAALFAALSLWCVFGEKSDFSESERRLLASAPEASWEKIASGRFATDFEKWTVDHFPARDAFRSLKARVRLYALQQKDNNGIYEKEGQLSKIDYPMNEAMLNHATGLFETICKNELTEENAVYVAVIPDKNKFFAPLSMDYDAFYEKVYAKMPFATPIEVSSLIDGADYYRTDTHLRQECLPDVAAKLAEAMGTSLSGKYEQQTLDTPFNGVYVGQSALSPEPDTLKYLTNETIEGYEVTGAKAVYDMEKAAGRDPYEIFLSGNQPLVTVKNPANPSGKRLILFRDSFGSAVAPLLAEGYSEVVLVDLRYLVSGYVGKLVDFSNADVLFLYSTLLLNSSLSMK